MARRWRSFWREIELHRREAPNAAGSCFSRRGSGKVHPGSVLNIHCLASIAPMEGCLFEFVSCDNMSAPHICENQSSSDSFADAQRDSEVHSVAPWLRPLHRFSPSLSPSLSETSSKRCSQQPSTMLTGTSGRSASRFENRAALLLDRWEGRTGFILSGSVLTAPAALSVTFSLGVRIGSVFNSSGCT